MEIRRIYCSHYNGCLDIAILLDWPSFTCESCPDFQRIDLTQARSDMVGFAALIQAVPARVAG